MKALFTAVVVIMILIAVKIICIKQSLIMDKSIESVEAMLGHKLNKSEKQIYNLFKDDDNYAFAKDQKGKLRATLVKR